MRYSKKPRPAVLALTPPPAFDSTGYGQESNGWPDATVGLNVTNAVLGGAVPFIPYSASGQSFDAVTLTSTQGTGARVDLTFALSADSLPGAYLASATLAIANCSSLEYFFGNVCVCKPGSVQSIDRPATCVCAEGFHTFTVDGQGEGLRPARFEKRYSCCGLPEGFVAA